MRSVRAHFADRFGFERQLGDEEGFDSRIPHAGEPVKERTNPFETCIDFFGCRYHSINVNKVIR
jgi:hypothetical protein